MVCLTICVNVYGYLRLSDMLFSVLLVLVLLLVLAQRWLCICTFECVVLLLVFLFSVVFSLGLACRCI